MKKLTLFDLEDSPGDVRRLLGRGKIHFRLMAVEEAMTLSLH
jgi:hypothetical protein